MNYLTGLRAYAGHSVGQPVNFASADYSDASSRPHK